MSTPEKGFSFQLGDQVTDVQAEAAHEVVNNVDHKRYIFEHLEPFQPEKLKRFIRLNKPSDQVIKDPEVQAKVDELIAGLRDDAEKYPAIKETLEFLERTFKS